MSALRYSEKGTSWLRGCCLYCVVAPLGLLVVLAMIFAINNRRPSFRVPPRTLTMPKDNGYDDFVRAANGPSLTVLRQGLNKECVCPPRTIAAMKMSVKTYRTFVRIGRALIDESKHFEATGRPGKAMDSRLDCIEFGVMLARGDVYIGGLVGGRIESIGSEGIGSVIPPLDKSELARVAQRLERIRGKRVPFGDILLEDGRYELSYISSVLTDRRYASAKWALPLTMAQRSQRSSKIESLWPNLRFAFANKSEAMRRDWAYYQAAAKEVKKPYSGKSGLPAPWGPLSQDVHDQATRYRGIFAEREALLLIIQTEVALRRYLADCGRYPERLDALAPTYLKSVPLDPFGQGRALSYNPIKGGKSFLLYSIGPDMKDDGGHRDGHYYFQGDIVAGKF